MNQAEGAAVLSLFPPTEYEIVPFAPGADIYLVNTCTVTHLADRKSRQILRRAVRENPQALVVAMGCYSQINPEQVAALEGIDLVVGTNNRRELPRLLQELSLKRSQGFKGTWIVVEDSKTATAYVDIPAAGAQQRVRSNLKIEDGCNNFCTYCIIPYARGPVRSKPFELAVSQAKEMIAQGYPEIVLTGIHTGVYGQDLAQPVTLAELAQTLAELPGLKRLRLGSVEPPEVTDQLLQVMASHPVICPHLHIPLQAGDDATLARMGRHYDTKTFAEIVTKIRQALPEVGLSTDIMVGFPGESDQSFQNSLAFAQKIGFAKLHVFPYSRRPGTKAADFPDQIGSSIKNARAQEMGAMALASAQAFAVLMLVKGWRSCWSKRKRAIGLGIQSNTCKSCCRIRVRIGRGA